METMDNEDLPRRLGAVDLGAAVFNTVVGAGIFVTPAALARDLGAAAPAAYLACVVIMGAVSLCFAAAGSRTPASGGAYAYARVAFGPLVGFLVGALVWISAVLAAGGIAAAVVDNLAHAWPALGEPLPRAGVIVALFVGLALVNVAGATPGARLVIGLTVAKLAPLGLLLAFGAAHIRPANLAFHPPAAGALGRAMILGLFAFQGMETALGASGEVRQPARNVPRGLLCAMGLVAILYAAIQITAQGVLGPALGAAKAPLVQTAAVVGPWLAGLVLAGASVSMLGYLAGDTLGAPRLLFSFAREGLAPRALGVAHPRSQTPHRAIWLHVALAAVLAVTGGFTELATLSSLTTVVVYIVACAAAVRLQSQGVALAGPPLVLRGISVAALVGILAMGWVAAHAAPAEAIGTAGGVAVVVLWYGAARLRARRTGTR
jgi:basic amino acid/polyamine antiporter, APA family